MKISDSLGYKLYKEQEDGSLDIIRVMHVRKYVDGGEPSEITIKHINEENSENEKVRVDSLKGYTPLMPDGLCKFSTVSVKDMTTNELSKDVIITAHKINNIMVGDGMPFAICRQSVTDVFHNLFCHDESEMIAGLSINLNNIPAGFDYGILLTCEEITYSDNVYFYRTDTLENILDFVKISKFDKVLSDLYEEYCTINPAAIFRNECHGWCKNLKKLLSENTFQSDLDEMFGITSVDFDISEHILEDKLPDKEEVFTTVDRDLKLWLSSIYKLNLGTVYILEYDHDINIADYNDMRYFLLRDSNKKLYMAVYTLAGEYKEAELSALDEQLDFSSKFRIHFMSKYNKPDWQKK